MLLVGLAPAAHGGNRTGRMFTGDRSGDWLYAALHRAGLREPGDLASTATTGCGLRDAYVTAVNRCAPPANKPTPAERDNCLPFLVRSCALLERARVIVTLGSFALGRALLALRELRRRGPAPEAPVRARRRGDRPGRTTLLGCYHPSQQNTFTGRLTEPMMDAVFARARDLARRRAGR